MGLSMFPQCRWAPTSKFRGTTTLCSICKKKTLVDRTLPSLSLLAGKERTSWMLAPRQSGHAGSPGHSPAGGSCWKWWRWIHTWGACSCPADGAGSSQRRSESRKQWLKRCPEEVQAPTRPGGGGRTGSLSLAPLQGCQLKGTIVCRRQMCRSGRRHRGAFLLFSMTDLCHSKSGRSRCPGPSRIPGSREPAGHEWPFPIPLEMSKRSRTPSSRGLCSGGVKLGQGEWRPENSWKLLPREKLILAVQGREASAGQEIPSVLRSQLASSLGAREQRAQQQKGFGG